MRPWSRSLVLDNSAAAGPWFGHSESESLAGPSGLVFKVRCYLDESLNLKLKAETDHYDSDPGQYVTVTLAVTAAQCPAVATTESDPNREPSAAKQ